MRRKIAIIIIIGIAITLAGCTSGQPLELNANQASVQPEALANSSYQTQSVETVEITRQYNLANFSREVHINNEVVTYGPSQTILPKLYVVSSPSFPAESVTNPFATEKPEKIIEETTNYTVYNTYEIDQEAVIVMDEAVKIEYFNAEIETNQTEQSTQVNFAFVRFKHGGDHIVMFHFFEASDDTSVQKELTREFTRGLKHDK